MPPVALSGGLMRCTECSAPLDEFDVGCYLKLVNRGAKKFKCRKCLAGEIGWTDADMDRAIRRFREQGCALFPPLDPRS